jgi:CRISPR/Cas system-associated protein Cas7 (RAMP superfamily)
MTTIKHDKIKGIKTKNGEQYEYTIYTRDAPDGINIVISDNDNNRMGASLNESDLILLRKEINKTLKRMRNPKF